MNRKLYVGNLPFETTETDLQELFGSTGSVATVHLVRDRETGRARGFAFVEMTEARDAETAISQLNGAELNGRALNVNEARPKPDSGARYGNRGGGGGGDRGRSRGGSRW